MSVDPGHLLNLIEAELAKLGDNRVASHVRPLLVTPGPIMRSWDYGEPGEQYPCWTVLEHVAANTAFAYCEHGFGPKLPWGLLTLHGNDAQMAMGMDSGWFESFLDVYFASWLAAELPIWRVFKGDNIDAAKAVTDEYGWDACWAKMDEYRAADPSSRYHLDTSLRRKISDDGDAEKLD